MVPLVSSSLPLHFSSDPHRPPKSTAVATPDERGSPPNSVFSLQQLLLSDTSKKGARNPIVDNYRITRPQGKFFPNPSPSVSGYVVP